MKNYNLVRENNCHIVETQCYNLVIKNMASFGEWVSAYRKEARLTQEGLAKKAGISPSYVSAIERNQKHSITGAELMPDIEKVDSLAKALNRPINEARLAAGYAPISQNEDDLDATDRIELMAMYSKRRKLTPTKREAFSRILDMVERELEKLYQESLIEEKENITQTNGKK